MFLTENGGGYDLGPENRHKRARPIIRPLAILG